MGPVTLVLVLSLSDGTAASRAVLLRTLSSALDPARVNLQPRILGSTKREALTELSAQAPVVEVLWTQPQTGTIRAALRPSQWVVRQLTFNRTDPLAERAKAIAFTVAAMMPEWRPDTPREIEADAPVPEVSVLTALDFAPPVFDAGTPEPAAVVSAPQETVQPTAPPPKPPVAESPPANLPEVAVAPPSLSPAEKEQSSSLGGLTAIFALGTAGQLTGGGGIDVALCPIQWLCAGISGAAALGELSTVGATRLDIRAQAIADVRVPLWWNDRLGLTGRGSAGAAWLQVQRQQATQSRWVAIGSVEGGLLGRFRPIDVTLTLGAGLSGVTAIYLNETKVAEIAAISGFGRLGVGWRW